MHWILIAMPRRYNVWLVAASLSILFIDPLSADQTVADMERLNSQFGQLDVNHDRQLQSNEWLQLADAPPSEILQRDFLLFDMDQSGTLSEPEFVTALDILFDSASGTLPDPYDLLVSQAMDAADFLYGGWNERPDQQINARFFVTDFLNSISSDDSVAISGRLLNQADANRDDLVSRNEALSFFKQQLGVNWQAERPMRWPDGQTLHLPPFLDADQNGDDEISPSEFERHWWHWDSATLKFEDHDINGDGRITFAEYGREDGPQMRNPVAWFRAADSNLDAYLQPGEMESATTGRACNLVLSSFQGFDKDQDGRLSLTEYRLTMHANFNDSWDRLPQDRDGDGRLSFAEFQFHKIDLFHLQRLFYFHRLDRDRDGYLGEKEFVFRKAKRSELVMISVDGSQTKPIYRDDTGTLDSPDLSPDGRRLLFHRYTADDQSDSEIMLWDLETGQLQALCPGIQPSWSDDGNRFVCARRHLDPGIWIMQADGKQGIRIADGLAPQWSPSGAEISYLNNNGIWIYDVATGKTREVLSGDEHPYQYLWWNTCWSPESDRIIFRGVLQGRSEAVLLRLAEKPNLEVRLSEKVEMGTEFVWSPDGRRILFPMRNDRQHCDQIFELDPDSPKRPRLAVELDRGLTPKTGCFTPDGKWYIAVLQH